MDLPSQIQSFWSETARDAHTPVYDIFHFDDNEPEPDANELADLVL